MFQLLDDGLDGRKAGAGSQEDDWLVRILAQEESTQRAFDAQDVAFLQGGEDLVGEQPSGRWRMCRLMCSSLCGAVAML